MLAPGVARWQLYEDRPQLANRGVDIVKHRGEVLAIFGLGWSVGLLILSNKITPTGSGYSWKEQWRRTEERFME